MKCFILVGTFSASLKKSLCELSPSSQATEVSQTSPYEKGVQHRKIGTDGYGGVKADV